MEFLRQRIEANVLAISRGPGSADFLQPPGDPGLFGPDSAAWQVHSDFTAMLTGGVAALLLQMLHPLPLAGVWDHSNFQADMLGRLRRTEEARELALQLEDPAPLEGPGHAYFGFDDWETELHFDNLVIRPGG